MKLEQACRSYGVLGPDYERHEQIDYSEACMARISQLVDRLAQSIGLSDVQVTPSRGPMETPQIAGLRFAYEGAIRHYNWLHTTVARTEYGWRCGLVEAMYRRWVFGHRLELPSHVVMRIPYDQKGWEL